MDAELALALAAARHEAGDLAGAERGCRTALALDPACPAALWRLGTVLQDAGRPAEAAGLLRRAVQLAPRAAAAWNNLGAALKALGRPREAAAALSAAHALLPDHIGIRANLGAVLLSDGRPTEATPHLLAAAHAYQEARHLLSLALYRRFGAGDPEGARAEARAWLAARPEDPLARHAAASLGVAPMPTRASDGWVRDTFDRFAPGFDARLRKLRYAVPEAMAELLARHLPDRPLDAVLDAGCGTGLMGPHLRRRARTLDGVDLSPRMLAEARAKGLYDHLFEAEVTGFLGGRPAAYDLVAACDVLIYLGDPAPLVPVLAAALRPGGWLGLSLEAGPGLDLAPSGRYRHALGPVLGLLADARMETVAAEGLAIRHEAGDPVPGHLILALRP